MDIEKNRVTLLISSLAGGGAEGVCVNVANGLVNQGWVVDLVVLHLDDQVYLNRLDNRVNLVDLDTKNARNSFLPLSLYILKEKPDKFLVFNYELSIILVFIRCFLMREFKIAARNINTLSEIFQKESGFWLRFIVNPLIKSFYFNVDYIINQCEAMKDDLVNNFPCVSSKTGVIYNPVSQDIEEFSNGSEFKKIKKQSYLLCVGRLEKQKAFHYSIEAFSRLANDFPELRLKIVGKGSLEQDLRQYAMKLGVSDKVDFEGFKVDMIPYYTNAKATLLTSIYEGFPNVLVESIALGTPVVSFNCPSGPSEIIQEGINGFLCNYKDIEDFRLKLTKLLSCDFNVDTVRETVQRNQSSVVAERFADIIRAL
ncbi:glycosyltransferase [Pseudoalteromonas sp. BDTF-M6]|uniref:glycosyltransferase n=1 Tax=Pseudoalteromonas sp. BDTF-M6 TaxID=2796132 RepID=UPI001BB01C1A|nr:glycosyltransferase [Pseudoalteromonas sp. BDTF-M6]MBS3798479.1 glycosyltransferase [Pseudoalteromonas sp. BDTF-M6]